MRKYSITCWYLEYSGILVRTLSGHIFSNFIIKCHCEHRLTHLHGKELILETFYLDDHRAVFQGGGEEFPQPACLVIQVSCDPVASDIRYFIFHSIFTSCGTSSQKQSSITARINKLKEDAHYQSQTFLLFEAFSISLSLHQHR